jgi:hypothetical protein
VLEVLLWPAEPNLGPMGCNLTRSRRHQCVCARRRLTDGACTASLVASNASIKAPLEPLKLVQGIGEGGREVGS